MEIVRALRWLDGRRDVDTIIVTRGGGSIEDLWAFNDEHVARAIFEAEHPIIVGVGHETDFTIADFVADVRAPTPSAAAELAVPDRNEVAAQVRGLATASVSLLRIDLDKRRGAVSSMVRALGHLSPTRKLESGRQQVDWLVGRLDQAVVQQMADRRSRFMIRYAALEAVSPLSTLRRGYAIVRKADGTLVKSDKSVRGGDRISVQVADGKFDATVNSSA